MIDLQEAMGWLDQEPDSSGECDGCHRDGGLWQLPVEIDQEAAAQWLYCRKCFKKIVTRRLTRPQP